MGRGVATFQPSPVWAFYLLYIAKNEKSRKNRNFRRSIALILERMRWRGIQTLWLLNKWLRRNSGRRSNFKKNSAPPKNQIQKERRGVSYFEWVHNQPIRHYKSIIKKYDRCGETFGHKCAKLWGILRDASTFARLGFYILCIKKWKHSGH